MARELELDKAVNVRLSADLYERLQTRLHRAAVIRSEYQAQGRKIPPGAISNMSDVLRRTIETGLDILENNRDAIREIADDVIREEIERILAQAIDPKKLKAAMVREPEPNFG